MIWMLAAFGAVALWAVVALIDDNITKGIFKNPYAGTIASGLTAPLAWLVLPFVGFEMMAWPIAGAAFVAGALTIFSYWFFYRAILEEAASITIALYNISVLFTLGGALLLFHESLTVWQYIGGAVILIAATGLTVKRGVSRRFAPSFVLMILASIFISAVFLLTKYVYDHADFWSGFAVVALGMTVVSALFAVIPKQGRDTFRLVISSKQSILLLFIFSEIINVCAVASYGYAISLGPLSVVQLIIASQPAIILLISFIGALFRPTWFREATTKNLAKKFAFIVLMAVGVYFVSAGYFG
ncbi:MAG: hypothetical protein ABIG66_05600 [Candidatus Kerfeldbacteria bacterium]